MSGKVPTSIWQGEFTIFGVTLHCHVLDNGERVIEADDVARLMAAMGERDCDPLDDAAVHEFARWMREGTKGTDR